MTYVETSETSVHLENAERKCCAASTERFTSNLTNIHRYYHSTTTLNISVKHYPPLM